MSFIADNSPSNGYDTVSTGGVTSQKSGASIRKTTTKVCLLHTRINLMLNRSYFMYWKAPPSRKSRLRTSIAYNIEDPNGNRPLLNLTFLLENSKSGSERWKFPEYWNPLSIINSYKKPSIYFRSKCFTLQLCVLAWHTFMSIHYIPGSVLGRSGCSSEKNEGETAFSCIQGEKIKILVTTAYWQGFGKTSNLFCCW